MTHTYNTHTHKTHRTHTHRTTTTHTHTHTHHEALNAAMEYCVLIVAAFTQRNEILARFGRLQTYKHRHTHRHTRENSDEEDTNRPGVTTEQTTTLQTNTQRLRS